MSNMGKFWGGGSSSETEEESSDYSQSDSEEIGGGKGGEIIFSSTESSSDDVVQQLKSEREKVSELLDTIEFDLGNAVDEKDWGKINEGWIKLDHWMTKKAKNVIRKHGYPGTFLLALTTIEDCINQTMETEKETKKDMNRTNFKNYVAVKQKFPKFLKKNKLEGVMKKYREDPDAFDEEQWEASENEEPEPSDEEERVAMDPFGSTTKIDWNDDIVQEKLSELMKLRGRRKVEKKEIIEKLKFLLGKASSPQKKVDVYMQTIACMFDSVSTNVNKYMKPELWNNCRLHIRKLLILIHQNPDVVFTEDAEDDNEDFQGGDAILMNLRSFVEKLDTEFIKSLQNIDPHTNEYIDRLKDESLFLELAAMAQQYYTTINDYSQAVKMAQKRVEHIYYKLDSLSEKIMGAHQERKEKAAEEAALQEEEAGKEGDVEEDGKEGAPEDKKEDTVLVKETDIAKELKTEIADLEKLCTLIYKYGGDRVRTKAMLCHVYHHALHGRFYVARDIFLTSHIQDNIQFMDTTTKILFNRTVVQLGLCAFRSGLIQEAHECLSDIVSGGRIRELLAQGMTSHQRFPEKNSEQEILEKKRQIPYHMHLSLELVETCYLTSAMLIEIPEMASKPYEKPKSSGSRFRRFMDLFERQVFTGPPETTRDFVVIASKHLSKGEWKKCSELLLNLPVWEQVHGSEAVKKMLNQKIQEQGLVTYLFTYSKYYDSLSLTELSNIFELPENKVHSIVSRMMTNNELHAAWDQPSGAIVMHNIEPTRLQYLTLKYADRVGILVENNEKLLAARTGSLYYKNFDKPQHYVQKGRYKNNYNNRNNQKYNNKSYRRSSYRQY
eukprot:CAMPEP_0174260422 /NCGR_PEP_ID=MMETSP0439-20130205/9701_1 /TAXON_ID=0 /ORGANISM="Stereomyxa ramosa, Strain Chinc5" /LENGTH=835 /DNA_ID=CAMNT_0015344667 /DNA_START=80 /DNA_END=2587 /DNA_ORIENTATION=+